MLGGCDDPAETYDDDYAPSDEKGDINGADDRIDRYKVEVDDPRYELARSSALLTLVKNLSTSASGGWELKLDDEKGRHRTLGEVAGLCEGERFAEQPFAGGGSCSGTLIAPDLMLTAGHCFSDAERVAPSAPVVQKACDDTKVVFDFAYDAEGDTPSWFPENDVYQCKKVLARELHRELLLGKIIDYAIIKLDRDVEGRSPVPLRGGSPMDADAPVTQVGHPYAIPQKLADGVVLGGVACGDTHYDSDVLAGNSGSGLFDVRTRTVAGVFARSSGRNYTLDRDRGCNVIAVCGENVSCPAPVQALGVPEILSRLSPDVLELLSILEVGGPSRCR